MASVVAATGRKLERFPGDGHCLFRAFAQFNGGDLTYRDMRMKLHDALMDPGAPLELLEELNAGNEAAQHATLMSYALSVVSEETVHWGTATDAAVLAQALDVGLKISVLVGGALTLYCDVPDDAGRGRPVLELLSHDSHWSLLVPAPRRATGKRRR